MAWLKQIIIFLLEYVIYLLIYFLLDASLHLQLKNIGMIKWLLNSKLFPLYSVSFLKMCQYFVYISSFPATFSSKLSLVFFQEKIDFPLVMPLVFRVLNQFSIRDSVD